MDNVFTEFARGEPVAVTTFVTLLLAAVGIKVEPGVIGQLIAAVVILVGAWKARKHATPAANPAIPYVHVDTRTDEPKPATKPVITFAGRRG